MQHKSNTTSEQELIELACEFAEKLKPGDIITLEGELGAGKTTFVKGIAKFLKIKRPITSPTFNIVKEYDDKLCHIDAYRVHDEDLAIDDYLDREFIICIEWHENIVDYIPYINYHVKIDYNINGRVVEINKK